ncbi:MAG TPA: radical SAM protein [Bacteroidales bacterium]|nr:radical SAM protein [Bacteroidales bacterium]
MFFTPIKYNEPVFRPPAESKSVIIQATLGCSWNKCAFCEMYSSKKFSVRSFDALKPEIIQLAQTFPKAKKIFLADGNAFVLSANKLLPILSEINHQFERIQRISSYALPKDILSKSERELKALRALGLKLLYVGIETGDDELLRLVNKGETYHSTVDGIQKAHDAGIDTSIMIINGLGGKKFSRQHALRSADIINRLQPKFLSTLTLSLPFGYEHFQHRFDGVYQQQTVKELFEELMLFIEYLEIEHVIYRSDHVSNNLVLKGVLAKDKEQIISHLKHAINSTPDNIYPSTSTLL